MKDEELIKIIKAEDVNAWNDFRAKDLTKIIKLNNLNLSGLNLSGIDLRSCYLNDTNLSYSNLEKANLNGANLHNATLINTNLKAASLLNADLLEANLENANLQQANLKYADLSEACFLNAVLSSADLMDAEMILTDFRRVDLSGANLTNARALEANFHGAKFTGSCLDDWFIDSSTDLKKVICDFVYLQWNDDREKFNFSERTPPNRNFSPGEFTKLFTKANVIELIFEHGVDWISFAVSLDKLSVEYEEAKLDVRGIENKNGQVVIKVEVAPGSNKEKLASYLFRDYELAQKVLEGYQYPKAYLQQTEKAGNSNVITNLIVTQINQFLGDNFESIKEEIKLLQEQQKASNQSIVINQNFNGSAEGIVGYLDGNQYIYPSHKSDIMPRKVDEETNI